MHGSEYAGSVGLTAGPPATAAHPRNLGWNGGGEAAAHVEICLVGAGPRGLSVLERLCARENKSPSWDRITVHVVDPDPPGAGRVWRPAQSRHLLMNTVASQVTVYTDASVRIDGPLDEGPSLYEWARSLVSGTLGSVPDGGYGEEVLADARRLGPDTYPTRALYGSYLNWAFDQVVEGAAVHVTVRTHPHRAVALEDEKDTGREGAQTVVLDDGTRLTGLSAVVLAQGHVPARPTAAEETMAQFAVRHQLTYLAPSNPADVDLTGVAPGEHVLLRGLGLNFFDYLALFTHGRGGVFTRSGGRVVYRPSGREPRLYAGSRRGVPYQARGENEKGAHGRYFPRLLTAGYIASLRARSTDRGAIDFAEDLWPLISKEVRSVYYAGVLTQRGAHTDRVEEFVESFLDAEPDAEEEALLDAEGFAAAERWDWERVARPFGHLSFRDRSDFRAWLRAYLDDDVRLARQGNVTGPLKAALDLLRDLRNELRLAIDHAGLTAASHRRDLDGWYTPLNAFLSIGPPVSRIEEMTALIDAGILEVTGPGLQVDAVEDDPLGACFVGTSSELLDVRVRATVLIEARLPDIDLRRTGDPLMQHLLRTGQCTTHRVPGVDPSGSDDYETGGLAVSERPYHLLDATDAPHPRRFAYGVPTESVHWVTAAGIRPGVGSVTLEDSDAIAAALLALPELPWHRSEFVEPAGELAGADRASAPSAKAGV
ncbi:FAD/NAD(P)-binding protein [Streptomyces sp. YIM 130001]|uniref:FAD/NAD(P)-binding protein n=1 Tax=Streptomyces sp. YIM 130001 TaxID=2259644 RepID=UPI000E65DA66|nr:FAD/NAD(P)-binding protein [Streptomyces sp. YIM 130001]